MQSNNNSELLSSFPYQKVKQPLSTLPKHDYNTNKSVDYKAKYFQVEAVSLQLFGLHHKLVNMMLRLAEYHLRNYWSSSAMQALRTSARQLVDSVALLSPLGLLGKDKSSFLK